MSQKKFILTHLLGSNYYNIFGSKFHKKCADVNRKGCLEFE